jgi:glycosyltransferase involved in cell wall biosynthesis
MSQPLVSIVIATRERPELLQRAIHSILRQSLQEIEIIVVDDGSSQPVLESYSDAAAIADPRVSYHSAVKAPHPVRGACQARNYGLSLAQSPYFVFFDDDDEMVVEDHLETALRFYREYPGSVYFADIRMVNDGRVVLEGRFLEHDKPMLSEQISANPPVYRVSHQQFAAVVAHRWPHPNAAVYETAVARSLGGLTDGLQPAEDLNFCLRYIDRASCVIYRRESVAIFDVTPRPRLFAAFSGIHRDLIGGLTVSHALASISNKHLLRAAARVHAHFLSVAAEKLNESGSKTAARHFARLSLAIRISGNGVRQFVRSLLR